MATYHLRIVTPDGLAFEGEAEKLIVRTTEDAGSFTVNVASSGLTGGSATVTTTAVSDTTAEGLASYTMVKDYTVKAGTAPELDTAASGTLADGSSISGTIVWDAVSADTYNTPGDYTVSGTLTFAPGATVCMGAQSIATKSSACRSRRVIPRHRS